jgi:hypothetical protein
MKNKLLLLIICQYLSFYNPLLAIENQAIKDRTLIPVPDPIESFNNNTSLNKLLSSQFNNDFFQLINFYQPQINPIYCAIASSVMVINALNYGEINNQESNQTLNPINNEIIEYKILLQQNFLNEQTDKIKDRDIINFTKPAYRQKISKSWQNFYDPGLNIEDLSKILIESYQLAVEKIEYKKLDQIDKFRKDIKKILKEPKAFIIANFDGKLINKATNGHVAPIVAYDQISDEILILDPALHKNKWFWISLENFAKAMNTKDGENFRGYLIISKKNNK